MTFHSSIGGQLNSLKLNDMKMCIRLKLHWYFKAEYNNTHNITIPCLGPKTNSKLTVISVDHIFRK